MRNIFVKKSKVKQYKILMLTCNEDFKPGISWNKYLSSAIEIMNEVGKQVRFLEIKKRTEILINNDFIVLNKNMKNSPIVKENYQLNPCYLTNKTFVFYVYKNSLTDNDFIKIFKKIAKEKEHKHNYLFSSDCFEHFEKTESTKHGYLIECAKLLYEEPEHLKQKIELIEKQDENQL